MRWDQMQDENCSVARTLSVIGDRWTMLILRDAFLSIRKFEDFQKDLGISRQRLSERLKKLVDEGVLKKTAYQSGPERFEYRLTAKGLDLYPVIMAIVNWGDKYLDKGRGAPMLYKHVKCNHYFTARLSCSECGEVLSPRDVRPEIGPGKANVRLPVDRIASTR
jgi:DNA-binding HxlR family transcriptional regulator